jgi:hypothetical protein
MNPVCAEAEGIESVIVNPGIGTRSGKALRAYSGWEENIKMSLG